MARLSASTLDFTSRKKTPPKPEQRFLPPPSPPPPPARLLEKQRPAPEIHHQYVALQRAAQNLTLTTSTTNRDCMTKLQPELYILSTPQRTIIAQTQQALTDIMKLQLRSKTANKGGLECFCADMMMMHHLAVHTHTTFFCMTFGVHFDSQLSTPSSLPVVRA